MPASGSFDLNCGFEFVNVYLLTKPFRIYVLKTRLEVFSVHSGNVGQRDALWTFHFASAGIGTVAKTFQVHLMHHVQDPVLGFYPTLWQQSVLTHLGPNKEHGGRVLTGRNAGATTDTQIPFVDILHQLVGSEYLHGESLLLINETWIEPNKIVAYINKCLNCLKCLKLRYSI